MFPAHVATTPPAGDRNPPLNAQWERPNIIRQGPLCGLDHPHPSKTFQRNQLRNLTKHLGKQNVFDHRCGLLSKIVKAFGIYQRLLKEQTSQLVACIVKGVLDHVCFVYVLFCLLNLIYFTIRISLKINKDYMEKKR